MIRHHPLMVAVALGAVCTIRAGHSVAEEHDAAASEALFREGRRLMKSRDFAAACPRLEESLRLDPATGTLVNLADCEEQVGRTASAWQHWRAAADRLPAGDKRRAVAVQRAAALEKVLARLTIELAPSAPPDVRVKRDGTLLGAPSLGVALPVDPGRHMVVVSANGRQDREIEVTIQDREQRTVTVEPGAIETLPAVPTPSAVPASLFAPLKSDAPPTPVEVTKPTSPKSGSVLGYVLLGGGALGLGAAAYFGLGALAARHDAAAACSEASGANRCWADARDALDRDRRDSLYADISAGAGIAAAGVGLYLLLRPSRESPVTTAAFVPASGGGTVRFGGKF
jgi:hypothetical protein